MQTKIAFFDIDGTLIDIQSKRITEKTLEALQRLRAGGVKICLATGRSPVALPVFPGVEFDAYLTFNGSLCYTAGGETIFNNPIAHEDVQKIIANGAAIGRPVCVSVRDRLAANGTDVDLTDYFAIAKMVVPITDEFDTVCREDVYQLMMGGRKDEYDAILRGVDGAKIAAWWDRAVDVIPAGGGKGIGIEKMLAYYGLDKAEALAFGDGNNDREMLQAVGTGVAMENGSPELKALADEICGPVYEDGIYHYCADKGLI